MRKIVGIGETVLDIIFKNNVPQAAKAGGSVLNCIVSLGRVGLSPYFISELGNDAVGDMIIAFLKDNGIDTSFVERYNNGKTALALAFLNEHNDAMYSFYKHYPLSRFSGAMPEFGENDILFFGSFYGITKEIRSHVLNILKRAKQQKAIIIYDPNFRVAHLHELPDLLPMIIENMQYADIVRGSDEDFGFIFGSHTIIETYEKVKKYCSQLIVTGGSKYVQVKTADYEKSYFVQKINPLSTIGAGDSFNAGLILGLLQNNITQSGITAITATQWDFIVDLAIAFASDVCMSYENYISKAFVESMRKHRK